MTNSIISKFNDLYSVGKDEVILRNDDLTSWADGSINDTIVGLAAAIADEVLVTTLRRLQETFFDSAAALEDPKPLDTLAWDHYQLDRIGAIQAVGSVNLSRPNATAGDVTIAIGSRFATDPSGTDDEVVFETTETSTMTGTSLSIAARAVNGGSDGNVAATTITVVKTVLDDATITVSNTDVFAGGTEAETNAQFLDRIKKYLLTLRKATVAALKAGALNVGGVFYANVDESTADEGYITLYVADQNGNSNASLEAAVVAEMINWRAAGITVNVDGATTVEQTIALALTYDAGVDTEAVRLKAVTAAEDYRDGLDVGETLYSSVLIAAIQAVEGIKAVTVSNPSGDVEPDPDEIIRGGAVTTS